MVLDGAYALKEITEFENKYAQSGQKLTDDEKNTLSIVRRDAEQAYGMQHDMNIFNEYERHRLAELEYLYQIRGIRQAQPAAIFREGYAGYGNGWTGSKIRLLYPPDRKRGGRMAREMVLPIYKVYATKNLSEQLVPLRINLSTEKYRLKDRIVWNADDTTVPLELFVENILEDFGIPLSLAPQVFQSLQEQMSMHMPHIYPRPNAVTDINPQPVTGAVKADSNSNANSNNSVANNSNDGTGSNAVTGLHGLHGLHGTHGTQGQQGQQGQQGSQLASNASNTSNAHNARNEAINNYSGIEETESSIPSARFVNDVNAAASAFPENNETGVSTSSVSYDGGALERTNSNPNDSGIAASIGSTGSTGSTGTIEPKVPAESTTDRKESTESTGSTETTGSIGSIGSTETAGSTGSTEANGANGANGSTESTESKVPGEPSEPSMAAKAAQLIEQSQYDEDMRITIKINITIGHHQLLDQFEWDINNPDNDPEMFGVILANELSLPMEFGPAVAHAIREQCQAFTRSLFNSGYQFDGKPPYDSSLQNELSPSINEHSFLRRPEMLDKYTPTLSEAKISRLTIHTHEQDQERRELRSRRRQGRSSRRGMISEMRQGGATAGSNSDVVFYPHEVKGPDFCTPIYSSLLPGGLDRNLDILHMSLYHGDESYGGDKPDFVYNFHKLRRERNIPSASLFDEPMTAKDTKRWIVKLKLPKNASGRV
ncbi:Snf5 protein [Starmerella bacillaris]|uniref:Snf5 protein n=1 Tax=Starmerella bacillaris TaxID=1247836 RepID=A0AAV5RFI0_STABA|nr:Snf5 protein [Starmerella bacillaris]